MRTSIRMSLLFASALALASCQRSDEAPAGASAIAKDAPNAVAESVGSSDTTPISEENYALAETQVIFTDYKQRIANTTGTNGMGVFMHMRNAMSTDDRTVMRPNFDTLYSSALIDLTEPATLVMPETGGRYQSAWVITEEH